MNPQTQLSSCPSVFFDDTYVLTKIPGIGIVSSPSEDDEPLNSRATSVQPGEDDTDQIKAKGGRKGAEFEAEFLPAWGGCAKRVASSYRWRIRIWVTWANQIQAELRGPLQREYGV
ncbi:hypothetical protein QYF36_025261 [Acer negundo]|nr:hypothetical protein QYF36_025261 [Acer negundo]